MDSISFLNIGPEGILEEEIPTPYLRIDGETVRRNLRRMAEYAQYHGLELRPHTKTHKSLFLAQLQQSFGLSGLTVAKVGEGERLVATGEAILIAYPLVDPYRCRHSAELARSHSIIVTADSEVGVQMLEAAARQAGVRLKVLVDQDWGMGRTGVATPEAALHLAQGIHQSKSLELCGIMGYPGHIGGPVFEQEPALQRVGEKLRETLELFNKSGLPYPIISSGSTPTAFQSHCISQVTEIRPGTYIFNDRNIVDGGYCQWDDCAAHLVVTVVSNAVDGQVVVDGGTKTFTSDRCGPNPDSGFGWVEDYPQAKIIRLTEEHGQIDIRQCSKVPQLGERIRVVPNHICPCINLQDTVWWVENPGALLKPLNVDTRGCLV